MKITITIDLPGDTMSHMQYLDIANYLDRALPAIKKDVNEFTETEYYHHKDQVHIKCEIE
jgi:hypothetical protein